DLFARSDRGSIGSCGNTTIGYLSEDDAFSGTFFQQAFGMYKVRVDGDLVEAARFSLPSSDTRGIFNNVTIGDPSLALKLPAPPAPTSLAATAQNASVQLTWNSPTPAATYIRLYRSSNGGATWAQIAASIPGAQTSYLDTGLTNTVTYSYYATSVDSGSFEGPASNVASATPLNPNPPAAPTGLAATDTGNGDSLNVSWSANSESDLDHYTLWWGTSSGNYANSQNYPKATTTTLLTGLATNTRYYFALTATNTSNKTSGYSAEATGMPTGLRLAIRPPAMITDLKVTRSNNDLVLTWSKPLVDVGGQPCTVASFQIFRVVNSYNWNLDTVSTSAPNAKITIAASSATTYTYPDSGAASLAGTVTYLVVALDASGNRSPASNSPPSPILSLKVADNVASCETQKTEISFTAVGTTIDGHVSLLDHYNLYGFYPMSHSSDHVKPSSPTFLATLPSAAPGSTVTHCDDSGALPPLFYTVVAVDNRGNTSLY
ncbi:MAG: fibronectin type III domain-containing protein, partial [Acidobacteria bacterium]|nr:fibronectin type III domain-containing protein [Acidobacteriota bacterium]